MDALSKKIIEDTLIDEIQWIVLERKRRFYYSSYEKPKGVNCCKTDQHKLYFHKLGTAQKRDKVILAQTKNAGM
jgi:prolyl oligopeptidase